MRPWTGAQRVCCVPYVLIAMAGQLHLSESDIGRGMQQVALCLPTCLAFHETSFFLYPLYPVSYQLAASVAALSFSLPLKPKPAMHAL